MSVMLTRAAYTLVTSANKVDCSYQATDPPDIVGPAMQPCWPLAAGAQHLELTVPVVGWSKYHQLAVYSIEVLGFQLPGLQLQWIECCNGGVGQLIDEVWMLLGVQLLL